MTVDAGGARSTRASVRLWEARAGCLVAVAGPWRARLGRNGIATSRHEGDGTTPAGTFPLGPAYGLAADPGTRLPYRRLVCGDWWDGDPASPTYNRFRHVACGARPPFAGGSEALWRHPIAYRHLVVIGFNAAPVVPGRGSAIFLHADTGRPTAGCVGLPLPELVRVLRWLRPDARPLIELGAAGS